MSDSNEDGALEATEEQFALLRDLGVSQSELEGLTFDDAEEWIAELRAMREDAGKIGGE